MPAYRKTLPARQSSARWRGDELEELVPETPDSSSSVVAEMMGNNLVKPLELFWYFFQPAGSLTCVGCVCNAEHLDAPHPFKPCFPKLDLRHLYAVIILSEELNFMRAAPHMRGDERRRIASLYLSVANRSTVTLVTERGK
jgi:hypothetical protein